MGDDESFPLIQRDFEDRRRILFRSGKGGNPAPNAVRGQRTSGPAFGGHGGSVILRGCSRVESLIDLPSDNIISAEHGSDGSQFSRGLHGNDRVVDLPLGTIIRERVKTDKKTPDGRTIYAPRFIYQFLNDNDTITLCGGGKGGVGPQTFKKGDGRKGANGSKRSIDLELRLINDCCLLGIPNSGKTSIISSLTSSLTRIGPEPYSTTRPHLGTLQFRDGLEVKLLDLPGVVEGSANDKERGIRILRHTYRSKLLMYCIDLSNKDVDAFTQFELLRNEVRSFDPLNFDSRKELIVATKCDMLHRDTLINLDSLYFRVEARMDSHIPVVGTSARFGLGINRLVHQIRTLLFPSAVGFPRPRAPVEVLEPLTITPNSTQLPVS
jgi:GTP-binding protein